MLISRLMAGNEYVALRSRLTKNPGVSAELLIQPFARSLALLNCSITHSQTRGKRNKLKYITNFAALFFCFGP